MERTPQPPRNTPKHVAYEDSVGIWLRPITSEAELIERLMAQMEKCSEHLGKIQYALVQELEGDNGVVLNQQLNWCDAQLYWVGARCKDADALLDAAEKFHKIPAGRSVICTTADGKIVPATGSRVTDEEADNFAPRFKELTDLDRNIELKALCLPYRRWRDEMAVMANALEKRLYRGRDLIEELGQRFRAAQSAESRIR